MSIFVLNQLITPRYLYDDTWARPLNPKLKFLRGLKFGKTLFFLDPKPILQLCLEKKNVRCTLWYILSWAIYTFAIQVYFPSNLTNFNQILWRWEVNVPEATFDPPPKGTWALWNLTIFILPLSLSFMVEYLAKLIRYLWEKVKNAHLIKISCQNRQSGTVFVWPPPMLSPPERSFFSITQNAYAWP